jgi:hypothetical protein
VGKTSRYKLASVSFVNAITSIELMQELVYHLSD